MTNTPTNTVSEGAAALAAVPDETTQVEAGVGHNGGPPLTNPDYWYGLINEREAGAFLGLTDRTMQSWRQRGGGPKFIRFSSRCIKYQRIILKGYAEERLRSSTSDLGEVA